MSSTPKQELTEHEVRFSSCLSPLKWEELRSDVQNFSLVAFSALASVLVVTPGTRVTASVGEEPETIRKKRQVIHLSDGLQLALATVFN
jgi:hypothetical protein